jgi:hypothetical protein
MLCEVASTGKTMMWLPRSAPTSSQRIYIGHEGAHHSAGAVAHDMTTVWLINLATPVKSQVSYRHTQSKE